MNEQKQEWKNITKAPKDGTIIKVSDGVSEFMAKWDIEKEYWLGIHNKGYEISTFRLYGLTEWIEA